MPETKTIKSLPKKIPSDDQEDILIALKSERCKRSFYAFVKEFTSEVSTLPYYDNDYIPVICAELERIGKRIVAGEKVDQHLCLNQSPSTSKSLLCSVLWPAWLWANDPRITIIRSSYAAGISTDLSTKCRQVIQSDKYTLFFPWVKLKEDRQNKNDYHTTMNGCIYSCATTTQVRGRHAILLILDDPDDSESVYSDVERKKTHDYISGTLSTRVLDPERTYMVLVQQRMHQDDSTNFLLSVMPGKFKQIVLPAEYNEKTVKPASLKWIYDKNDGLLDPVRLSREILQARKMFMGSRAFQTQYNQNPLLSESQIVKEGWFPIITQDEFNKMSYTKHFAVDFYLDPAYTEDRKHNDCSCLMATTKIDNFLYILNVSRVWLEFPDLIRHVSQWTQANGYSPRSRIVIEPKASGLSLFQTLRSNTGLNIIQGVSLNKHAGNKKQRVANISPILESERVILIKDTWNRDFLDECAAFTGAKGDVDDELDCLWMAVTEKLQRKSNYGKYNTR